MKKIIPIIIAVLLVITVGIKACSSNDKSTSLPSEEDTQEKVDKEEIVHEEVIEEVTEIIEEEKEEKDESKKEIDEATLRTYKYWVVFYNPDGTELQREALKWGTTPVFYEGTPYYYDGEYDYRFIGWTNKKGQPKELKPITGNTYFYASYEKGIFNTGGDEGSNEPAPDPEYIQLSCLTSTTGTGTYIKTKITANNDMKFVFKAKMNKQDCVHPFGYAVSHPNGLLLQVYSQGFEFYMGNTAAVVVTDAGLGSESDYEYQVKTNDVYIKVNGSTIYTNQAINPIVASQEIYIFAQNNTIGGITVWKDKPFTIYYFKIYQNGTLVRDFIPVKIIKEVDKSKNATDSTANIPIDTLCMYDKVSKMYYLNSGTVMFGTDPID